MKTNDLAGNRARIVPANVSRLGKAQPLAPHGAVPGPDLDAPSASWRSVWTRFFHYLPEFRKYTATLHYARGVAFP